ncbi:AMP-binding enzyme [Penicillium cataractarum]|uniref:AMP-binding enzyme n=1 Tax=Penicillium cataractarum TaxID=2100454 RepID=A0A9W9VX67_9EURO|nr:AMP-binding enzyme [Penicillium cataractarum]KAJ5391006.1 AMP-binding enzyme [Penicillium cataractarum]
MANSVFPLPGVEHGKRILVSVIESRARNVSSKSWVSLPINEQDLSQGYKDISFRQLNNYANHAAKWLRENLPPTSDVFQCFAYAGPKDLRYPILAVAAAKLQKVMVMPSPLITPEAQNRILSAKSCKIYLRPTSMADKVAGLLKEAPAFRVVTVPEIDEFMKEEEAPTFTYSKSWEEGKDDPWLVFHTSGTTGNPKPLTWSHRMMAVPDIMASLPDLELSVLHKFAQDRWYTPLPSLHVVGTLMILAMASFLESTIVIGPAVQPSANLVVNILHYGQVDGALMTPSLIEDLCLTDTGLQSLRSLKCLLYTGAPLAAKAGEKLVPHVHIASMVGSTEGGLFLTKLHDEKDAWDYINFQKHASAELVPRFGNLHELVFVRRPGCLVPLAFQVNPGLDRIKTSDMLVEHPVHKGLWKFIGRGDDYVNFSHGDGMHASLIEAEIEYHPAVKTALIGENGRPAPVLLVELFPNYMTDHEKDQFTASLQPYIENANIRCHDCVKLSLDRFILASQDKPFVRNVKGGVVRMQSLALYKVEISAMFD